MRIFLVGYMGCGKTTLGKSLAEELGFKYTDLDADFEERYKISITDFFSRYGESLFRQIEQKLLHKYLASDDLVISTGGGTACHFDNMEFMLQHGITVYLLMNPEQLAARLSISGRKRPMLHLKQGEELVNHISEHLAQREIFYSKSHIIYDGTNPSAGDLAEMIRSHALLIP
jgi:shikimate kinase